MPSLKIKKLSAADQVCEKIRALVLSGEWPVNERIPPEAQLSETFGVNRLTVRIALQRLNALGVLETRDGDGTYVRAFDFQAHLGRIADFYVTDEVEESVGEYRAVIEVECVRLAVKRVCPEDLEELKAHCRVFEDEVGRWYGLKTEAAREASFARTVDATLAFQTELCRLSGNPLFAMAFELAAAPIRRNMTKQARGRLADLDEDRRNIWVKAHWDLVAALAAHDFEACRTTLLRIIGRGSVGDD